MRFQSDLKIELVARNELGAIVALITPDGVVDAQIASAQIARGDATYVTGPDSFVRVPVRSISALGGAYLYANWDGSQRNNLHDVAAVRVRTLTTVECVDDVFFEEAAADAPGPRRGRLGASGAAHLDAGTGSRGRLRRLLRLLTSN